MRSNAPFHGLLPCCRCQLLHHLTRLRETPKLALREDELLAIPDLKDATTALDKSDVFDAIPKGLL